MRRIGPIIFLIIITLSCCNRNDKPPGIQLIDLTGNLNQESNIFLSDIATDIEYVPLETSQGNFLQDVSEFTVSKKYILIYDRRQNKVFLFNRQGGFITKIGRSGQGPGEFNRPDQVYISKDESVIYILNWKKILKFNPDGEYLETINLDPGARKMLEWQDGLLLSYPFPASVDFQGYSFGLFDLDGNLIERLFPPGISIVNTDRPRMMYGPYTYQDTLCFFTLDYDTVWGMSRKGEVYPRMVLKMKGEQRNPYEMADPQDLPTSGFWIVNFRETKDRVFIIGNMGRIMHPLIYNRESHEVLYAKDQIPNDLDGGMRFWPGKIVGNISYKFTYPSHFTYYREKGSYYEGEVKFPEKKTALYSMVDNIKEGDNPILVIVTLKD